MKTKQRSVKPEEKAETKVFHVGDIAPDDRPFASLLQLKNQLTLEGETNPSVKSPEYFQVNKARDKNDLQGQIAIVMRSSKGHHGKTVTLISNLDLNETNAKKLLNTFKSRFGVGGSVEEVDGDPVLLLQGDVRDRVETELIKMHAKVKRAGG